MFDQLEVAGEGEKDGVDVGPVWDQFVMIESR